MAPTPVCRYFAAGNCQFGSRCTYVHDRNALPNTQCRFYQQGSCVYGNACRFDHVREKKKQLEKRKPALVPRPKPAQQSTSRLSVDAPEFVPSWLKAPDVDDRPLCPYHELGTCTKGDCSLIHGLPCDLCQKNVLHPNNEQQRRAHVAECTREHERQMEMAFIQHRSKEKTCGICMENIYDKNLRFGILEKCKHCFCLECIREWRSRSVEFDSGVIRSCPECRVHSDYVVPSVIWLEEDDEKNILIDMYKKNTAQKRCKYYQSNQPASCQFGNKCFYLHANDDGSPVESVPPSRTKNPSLRRPRLTDFIFMDDDFDDADVWLDLVGYLRTAI